MKVYIIEESSGEYSDWNHRVYGIYDTFERAKGIVERALQHYNPDIWDDMALNPENKFTITEWPINSSTPSREWDLKREVWVENK